ncbi:hypothetical protein RHECNPAF_33400116 [Rhizobium etli CNPAF512]|nr:hypothetical protein RHECNPAF_33400116 [Rhizobium etli CNPAF512]
MWQRPSRWAKTGTRASLCTRATRLLPPRGTMTSIAPSRPRSMAPTAARSVTGTSWIACSGSPAAFRPSTMQAWIACDERRESEPQRRITALPALRQRAPASAVTFGRLSKMTPITPSGVRTRSIFRPFGRSQAAMTSPTGSARAAMARIPSAISAMRLSLRVSRSMKEASISLPSTSFRSLAFSARIWALLARIASAMAFNARFFASVEAKPNGRAAAFALRPMSFISASMSGLSVTVSSMGRVLLLPFRFLSELGAHHHVVAMDHSGASGITEDGLDLGRLAAGDPASILGIVAGKPAGDLTAFRADNRHRIAAAEDAGHAAHTGGKQALAGPEGGDGAIIDMQFAGRLQLSSDPDLAGGHRRARGGEPGGAGAVLDCRQRAIGLAGGDDHGAAGCRGDLAGIDLRAHAAA